MFWRIDGSGLGVLQSFQSEEDAVNIAGYFRKDRWPDKPGLDVIVFEAELVFPSED